MIPIPSARTVPWIAVTLLDPERTSASITVAATAIPMPPAVTRIVRRTPEASPARSG